MKECLLFCWWWFSLCMWKFLHHEEQINNKKLQLNYRNKTLWRPEWLSEQPLELSICNWVTHNLITNKSLSFLRSPKFLCFNSLYLYRRVSTITLWSQMLVKLVENYEVKVAWIHQYGKEIVTSGTVRSTDTFSSIIYVRETKS